MAHCLNCKNCCFPLCLSAPRCYSRTPPMLLSSVPNWVLRHVEWHHRQSKLTGVFEAAYIEINLSRCNLTLYPRSGFNLFCLNWIPVTFEHTDYKSHPVSISLTKNYIFTCSLNLGFVVLRQYSCVQFFCFLRILVVVINNICVEHLLS